MIAVIADDFTGAAEIGGVGLRYGLNVLIETEVNEVEGVDLLVIATDTRSLHAESAYKEVSRITEELLRLKPEFIFKKMDSVLRGHVAEELEAQMFAANKNRALIVAPNPSVGRIIVEGQYFLDSLPLNETSFAVDPEFPMITADVTRILRPAQQDVFSVSLQHDLPETGIAIADVTNPEALLEWAAKVSQDMVVAGGSGFFDALLGTKYTPGKSDQSTDLSFGESSLFILGSMYPKQENVLQKFDMNMVVKMNMPEGIYYNREENPQLLNSWSSDIAFHLQNGRSVIVTIDHQPENEEGLSIRLREIIGQTVALVEKQFELGDLFIEGGATTSEVLKCLKIKKLHPFHEADFGVIQMRAEGFPNMCITTKPGSYLWPENMVFEINHPSSKLI
jgi:uncharacterized protein YgbK (DUF1537 family)